MIDFLPELYEDELFYSFVARYITFGGKKTDILISEKAKPNPLFINMLTQNAAKNISAYKNFEDIIFEHTMLPCYLRFLPLNERKKYFEVIVENKGIMDIFMRRYVDIKDIKHFLNYCPMCVKKDREKFGEAYWHCTHQIQGIDVCPKHKCFLKKTIIPANSFITAEDSVKYVDAEYCYDPFINKYAEYLSLVFRLPMNFSNHLHIKKFIQSNFPNGFFYDSERTFINPQPFYDDLSGKNKYIFNNYFDTQSLIRKLFFDTVPFQFDEFCLLITMLNIPFDDVRGFLTGNSSLSLNSFCKLLPENEILRLLDNQYSVYDISNSLNVPVWLVLNVLRNYFGQKYLVSNKIII